MGRNGTLFLYAGLLAALIIGVSVSNNVAKVKIEQSRDRVEVAKAQAQAQIERARVELDVARAEAEAAIEQERTKQWNLLTSRFNGEAPPRPKEF